MKTKNIFYTAICILTLNCSAQELIQDRDFQQGFYVRDTVYPYSYFGPLIGDSSLPPPVWNTAEWGSKSSLRSISRTTLASGFYQWADANKDFRFGPVGAEEYELYFGVNSQSEYDSIYRTPDQFWPHLLIEQRFSPPYDFPGQGPGCPSFSNLDSLIFQIDAKLLYNLTIMNAGYDPTYHAAQFLIYFTVQNSNPSSSGYGKYVWLGMQLYDDRFAIPPSGVSYDIGTETLINEIPYLDFASVSTHNGAWVHAQIDLLPYALAALDTAWTNGFLNESTDLADYKIGGMNMGWELPGMNISTVGVKGISLVAYQMTTGIGEEKNENDFSVNIYPNPSSGKIEVRSEKLEVKSVEIYNVLGEKIASSNSSSVGRGGFNSLPSGGQGWALDLSSQPSGIYFLNIKTDRQSIIQKLLIHKI